MKVIQNSGSVPIKAWVDHVPPIEPQALEQLGNIAAMPFIFKHLAVMPDCHLGKGATVGSVVVTKGAIIPAAVGVDIGCGMCAVRTTLRADQLPDNLAGLRSDIEAAVPHGFVTSGKNQLRGAHTEEAIDIETHNLWRTLYNDYAKIVNKYPMIETNNPMLQLGSLGGGNHFIEICLDLEDRVWVMLHSGSRGIGNRIGTHFIKLAQQDMQRWFINLPDKDLAYIPDGSELFKDYCFAVDWAQRYAAANRKRMLTAVTQVLRKWLPEFDTEEEAINCHHNYVSRESHYDTNVIVTRKGAVSARKGELGIIPGSMGAKSFIVRGLGNRESFNSCSHGAGRVMSRTKAKAEITLAEHVAATEGVECRKDSEVIDESPRAYKNIDDVMRSQDDLVEIIHTLKQVLCVKG